MSSLLGLIAVLLLVLANGFFVAAEFSLVSVRRSRVAELVTQKKRNAKALQNAVDQLDANLAATQLGITISSLALGWIGEPVLAHMMEPLFGVFGAWAEAASHVIAVTIAFAVITTLHIVLGELAPKSLALQRSEQTALWVVRPLALFYFILRPAILLLNNLGNGVLKLFGLQHGAEGSTLHSAEELKILAAASAQAGLIDPAQKEAAGRIFTINELRVSDIMTPRHALVWVDAEAGKDEALATIRACRHEQLVVSRKTIDDIVGVVRKQDILDQVIDGKPLDPLALVKEALVIHETAPLLSVLEQFKKQPIRMAVIIDEYGSLKGVVTPADILEAIVGDLPGTTDEQPEVVVREDGSMLMAGSMKITEAFDRLAIQEWPENTDFHTLAGLALLRLGKIPASGDHFSWGGWRFEIVDMDGRRIDQLLVSKEAHPEPA